MSAEDFMLPCPTKKFFGIDCFGCGMQRAVLMVLKGDFQGAWHLYPPVFSILMFLIFVLLNFVDRRRNYSKAVMWLGIFNGIFIPVSYFYKHFA